MLEGQNGAKGVTAEHDREETRASSDRVACRQSAREALLARVRMLRREASLIEGLAMAIPENFPPDADEALWHLANATTR